MTIQTKCGTCSRTIHQEEADWGEGCLEGDIYGYCTSDLCYGFCDYQGYCPCDCHERDSKNHLTNQLRPSVWR